MNKLFVPYDLALLAKKKGFKEFCIAFWETFDGGWNGYGSWAGISEIDEIGEQKLYLTLNELESYYKNIIKAPLYQQLIDFVNSKGFSLKYGKIGLSLLDKRLEKCLKELESIR